MFCVSFLVLRRAITFYFGEVGLYLSTILNLSRSEHTENVLSNRILITIFSAILIGLKTLQNDEDRQHNI